MELMGSIYFIGFIILTVLYLILIATLDNLDKLKERDFEDIALGFFFVLTWPFILSAVVIVVLTVLIYYLSYYIVKNIIFLIRKLKSCLTKIIPK
jgi:chromate transport protein ChrA